MLEDMGNGKKHGLLYYANGPSLEEINSTVPEPKEGGFFKKLMAFSGPGALVAVGYMDPGNWVTSIGGGAQFGYLLDVCDLAFEFNRHVITIYGV